MRTKSFVVSINRMLCAYTAWVPIHTATCFSLSLTRQYTLTSRIWEYHHRTKSRNAKSNIGRPVAEWLWQSKCTVWIECAIPSKEKKKKKKKQIFPIRFINQIISQMIGTCLCKWFMFVPSSISVVFTLLVLVVWTKKSKINSIEFLKTVCECSWPCHKVINSILMY